MVKKLLAAVSIAGYLFMFAMVSQFSGCEGSSHSSVCYDWYGNYYYYCDYYYYDPYWPTYGYSSVYSSSLALDQYGQADPTLSEQTPEPIVNVEHMVYIAKTDVATASELTPVDFEEEYPCGEGDEALGHMEALEAALYRYQCLAHLALDSGLKPLEAIDILLLFKLGLPVVRFCDAIAQGKGKHQTHRPLIAVGFGRVGDRAAVTTVAGKTI